MVYIPGDLVCSVDYRVKKTLIVSWSGSC